MSMDKLNLYNTFCRLNYLNTVKKRGRVMLHERDDTLENLAVDNYFNAIVKAAGESNTLERVILVALRDLSGYQVGQLSIRLREYCASGRGREPRRQRRHCEALS